MSKITRSIVIVLITCILVGCKQEGEKRVEKGEGEVSRLFNRAPKRSRDGRPPVLFEIWVLKDRYLMQGHKQTSLEKMSELLKTIAANDPNQEVLIKVQRTASLDRFKALANLMHEAGLNYVDMTFLAEGYVEAANEVTPQMREIEAWAEKIGIEKPEIDEPQLEEEILEEIENVSYEEKDTQVTPPEKIGK